MSKELAERTTEPEVFQNMDNFELLNDSSAFALSLRLQFPKFSKGFSPSDFESFVKSHVGEGNLVALGRLSFPNEWHMQVASKEVRENLIRMGKTKIHGRTCWISPLSTSEVRGFIHWIPAAVGNKKLRDLLEPFGEVLLMENQRQTKFSHNVNSATRYFALYLKQGKTMDDVPHFIKVGTFAGLITIRGRNPACFHCKTVGHRKTECKTFREKLKSYSNRPSKPGKTRQKPRGQRHNPKKIVAISASNQVVQTDCMQSSTPVEGVAMSKTVLVEASKVTASGLVVGASPAEVSKMDVSSSKCMMQASSSMTSADAMANFLTSAEVNNPMEAFSMHFFSSQAAAKSAMSKKEAPTSKSMSAGMISTMLAMEMMEIDKSLQEKQRVIKSYLEKCTMAETPNNKDDSFLAQQPLKGCVEIPMEMDPPLSTGESAPAKKKRRNNKKKKAGDCVQVQASEVITSEANAVSDSEAII